MYTLRKWRAWQGHSSKAAGIVFTALLECDRSPKTVEVVSDLLCSAAYVHSDTDLLLASQLTQPDSVLGGC